MLNGFDEDFSQQKAEELLADGYAREFNYENYSDVYAYIPEWLDNGFWGDSWYFKPEHDFYRRFKQLAGMIRDSVGEEKYVKHILKDYFLKKSDEDLIGFYNLSKINKETLDLLLDKEKMSSWIDNYEGIRMKDWL